MSLATIGELYKDYDNGYTLEMLACKYKMSLHKVLGILWQRIEVSRKYGK